MRLTESAIELYPGGFLAGEPEEGWSAPTRERVREKFIRLVLRLSTYLDEKGRHEKAVEWFRKGLVIDGLMEEFYQQLMLSSQKLGQQAKAIGAYQACREMLASSLGVSPSSRTEAIHTTIKNQVPAAKSR